MEDRRGRSLRDRAKAYPFPLGWACFVAAFATATQVASGIGTIGAGVTFFGVMAALGAWYLYRVRHIDGPKYKWLRDRHAEQKASRASRRRA